MNLHTTSPAMGALFLLSGVAAGNLFLPSPGNNGGTDFVPKTDVTLSLSAAKTIFAADEPVLIKVTLKNNLPNGTAKILDWVLPCDKFNSEGEEVAADKGAAPLQMSHFDIRTSGNRVAAYEGAVVNRRPPGEGDYRTLAGGEEYACTVDLENYYKFDGKDGDDDYEISFVVVLDELSGPSDGEDAGGRAEILRSNSVELRIEGRASPSSRRGRREGQEPEAMGSTAFLQCSTSMETNLTLSRMLAVDAAAEVVELLNRVGAASSSSSCPRYEEWFSSYNSSRHQGLETDYNKIHNRLLDASIMFHCNCTDEKSYAYVYSNDPYDIYLCPLFWSSGMSTGTESKVGTVIHEISHFSVVADTYDHKYGQRACRKLAKKYPDKAVKNADNIAYVAENYPALECNTAPAPPTDPPSRAPTKAPVACDGLLLTVKVNTDSYPDDNSYEIKNLCTNSIIQKSPVFEKPISPYEETYCVDDAAYEFTMEDSGKDGMCCGYGSGSFAVTYDGTEVASGGEFGRRVTTKPFGNCPGDPCPVIKFKNQCTINTDCIWYKKECVFKECPLIKKGKQCRKDPTCIWYNTQCVFKECPLIEKGNQCRRDQTCIWYEKQCVIKEECSVYTKRNKCRKDLTCEWKNGACIIK